MALLIWKGVQLENMIACVDEFKDATFENFSVLVEELKLEFETKKFDVEAVLVFNLTIPADISKYRLELMRALMSTDLQEYTDAKYKEYAIDGTAESAKDKLFLFISLKHIYLKCEVCEMHIEYVHDLGSYTEFGLFGITGSHRVISI